MAKGSLNIIGPQVRRLRTAVGLSQSALAGACQRRGWDISRDSVAKIEAGLRWVCDWELLELSKALRCAVVELYPAKDQVAIRGRK
jgi:hypothetical protein